MYTPLVIYMVYTCCKVEFLIMGNPFKNGYTCKKCVVANRQYAGFIMTPVYFRIDKKFVFANLVNCPICGISESVSLRDL